MLWRRRASRRRRCRRWRQHEGGRARAEPRHCHRLRDRHASRATRARAHTREGAWPADQVERWPIDRLASRPAQSPGDDTGQISRVSSIGSADDSDADGGAAASLWPRLRTRPGGGDTGAFWTSRVCAPWRRSIFQTKAGRRCLISVLANTGALKGSARFIRGRLAQGSGRRRVRHRAWRSRSADR